jgi:hypothetical protein
MLELVGKNNLAQNAYVAVGFANQQAMVMINQLLYLMRHNHITGRCTGY